ncbi:zinc finger protein ZFPM1 [Mytilus galloprovincialis]|uniref:Zinc finger protein ZFPM1 n=1 Tax=Mytilus galloprovincialis TaxID=29158 RepID=A0A8B6F813_MYTGA|nr:zinc finger protein ZFPM1 [Mytilus galloprovincialis]
MSRRKQSNPKPFKKLSDDEDDEADMKSTESSKSDTESVSPCPAIDDSIVYSNATIKSEPASPEVPNDRVSTQDDKAPVIFLNDVLLLKKVDKDEAHLTGRSFLVCAAIPLPKGSCIGPFDAEIVSLSSIRQGDMVLQAQEENGETSFVRVEDPNATWLTMLRPAPSESVRNTSVFYKGGQIWCEIISELKFGAELLSSFTIQDAPKSEPCSPDSTDYKEKEDEIDMDIKTEVQSSPSVEQASSVAKNDVINHAALLYGCPFCGVRFSSARTLEGHLTYYCSKKPSNSEKEMIKEEPKDKESSDTEMSPESVKSQNDETEKQNDASNEERTESESNETKLLKNGELFHCPFCCYTSDKLSSLNRHKRIHCRGSTSPTSSSSSLSPVSKQDSYCAECNIQFSSFSTFKCHKEYYCSKRPDAMGMRTPEDEHGMQNGFPNLQFQEQMSPVASKNLKHLMNVSSASLMSGQTNVILGPPIVARGMLNMPFGMPTVIVQPVVPQSPNNISPRNVSHMKMKQKPDVTSDQPLDLSITKKSTSSDDSDKENSISPKSFISPDGKRRGSIKRDDVSNLSCSTSSSPVQSPIQRSSSVQSDQTTSPIPSNRVSPFVTVPPVQFISGKPIPPVPHSVSKCVDCNIVFYKHENYIIHKKHYCSSRQTCSNSVDDVDETSKDSEEMSMTNAKSQATKEFGSLTNDQSEPGKSSCVPKESKESSAAPSRDMIEPEPKQSNSRSTVRSPVEEKNCQYVCDPCKIRFSSTSTLAAHKEFYCPFAQEGRNPSGNMPRDNDEDKNSHDESMVKCSRCGASFPSAKILRLHYCTGVTTHVPLLRCPYCDYVTQTENRISEHLKVHMPSKAYRCTLCGYRGNTVRGMRMHGKMHIDNGEDFSDEHMVEIEEPPLVPIIFNNPNEATSTNVEAELIRLKNEPYKRRRSRKSYEKSEHMTSIREPSPKNVCVFCGQPFNDNTSLAMHMRIHEMVAYHAASSRNLKCHFCEYVAETFPSLMIHVEHKHLKDVKLDDEKGQRQEQTTPANSMSPADNRQDSEEDSSSSKPLKNGTKSPGKEEKLSTSPNETKKMSLAKELAQDVERERTLNLLNLPLKIKKEPEESDNNEDEIKEKHILNLNNNETNRKRKRSSSADSDLNNSSCSDNPPEKKSNNHIKSERTYSSDEPPSPLRSPVLNPELARYYQLAMQVMPPLVVPRVSLRTSPPTDRTTEKLPTNAKYCKYCDISFTYLATYVAHKKYYCTARQPEEMASPAKA